MDARKEEPVRASVQSAITELSTLIVPILRKYNIVSAFLFGSAARGEAGPGSDVDILVQYERGTTLFDIAGMKMELEETLARKVDLASPETLKPWVKESAMSEQVRLL